MRRMYFACTHVTLRATEVPLWLKAGIEVVPEEVDTGMLNRLEGLLYDDPALHAVLRQCERSSSMDPADYAMARRVRLHQRRGLIDPAEQDFFNTRFDAIYVPTNLGTAVNVRRWFKGTVLFRYFGKYANLRDIGVMAGQHDPADLAGIDCVPIFDTLYELGITDHFDRSATVHGCIDRSELGRRWAGPQPGQVAVTVINDIKEGSIQADIARALIPLADKVPLEVLGKNLFNRVPEDIMAGLKLHGVLTREEFLAKFRNARLLVHPFAERYHNHYTNLEAVALGVPVLFRTDNPLWQEQPAALKARLNPAWYGAYGSHEELRVAVQSLFGRAKALRALANRQHVLLEAFSPRRVRAELRSARELIAPRPATLREPRGRIGPHRLIGCAETVAEQVRFTEAKGPVPLAAFLREDDWRLLRADPQDRPVVALPEGPELHVIAGEDEPIAPGRYRLTLGGRLPADTQLHCVAEAFAGETRLAAIDAVGLGQLPQFELASAQPWSLSLHLRQAGAEAALDTIRLERLGAHTGPARVTAQHVAQDLLTRGEPVAATALLPGSGQHRLVPGSTAFTADSKQALSLGPGESLPPGRYRLRIAGALSGKAGWRASVELFAKGTLAAAAAGVVRDSEEDNLLLAEVASPLPFTLIAHAVPAKGSVLRFDTVQIERLGDAAGPASARIENDTAVRFAQGGEVPLAALPGHWQDQLAPDGTSVRLPAQDDPHHLLFAGGPELAAGRYRLTLRGALPASGMIGAAVEAWQGGKLATAAHALLYPTGPDLLGAELDLQAPWRLSLHLSPRAAPQVDLATIRIERIGAASGTASARLLDLPGEQLARGGMVPVSALVDPAPDHHDHELTSTLVMAPSAPLPAGAWHMSLAGFADAACVASTVELFAGDALVNSTGCLSTGRDHPQLLGATLWCDAPFTPVLHLRKLGSGRVLLGQIVFTQALPQGPGNGVRCDQDWNGAWLARDRVPVRLALPDADFEAMPLGINWSEGIALPQTEPMVLPLPQGERGIELGLASSQDGALAGVVELWGQSGVVERWNFAQQLTEGENTLPLPFDPPAAAGPLTPVLFLSSGPERVWLTDLQLHQG